MNSPNVKPLVAAIALATAATTSYAQDNNTDGAQLLEEVVVTGFRAAQAAALDIKRESANSVESIVAEDVGKMPDLNLAESLQRQPGVAITREGGEGRNITVRGLGPQYTRVTLNGMEVPASSGGLDSSGGVNRGRSFDFNVFSADLFRRMDINKNQVASIEEGGLASTVELYSLRPLDNAGLFATGSLQTNYNIHTGETDPLVSGVVSNSFMDDKVGVLLGVNYAKRNVHQEGFGSVRWTGPVDNFRGDDPAGYGWGDNPDVVINGTPNPGANYPDYQDIQGDYPNLDPIDYMWAPRLPRMDSFNHEQERTGVLAAIQAQPTDKLDMNLTHMMSELESDVNSYNYFAQIRNLHNTIVPTEVTLDPSGRYITAGTFENVQPRSESRGQFSNSEFTQTVANISYDFTDTLKLDVMLGSAESEHNEQQYRYNLTATQGHTFSYSFLEDSDIAEMEYGFDTLDPSNYEFTGPTHRDETVKRENQTFKVDLTWEFDDNGSNLMAGVIANDRTIDSRFTDDAANLTSPNAPSATNTNSLSDVVDNYGDGIDGPGGFPTNFLVADFDVVRGEYNAGQWNEEPNDSRTYVVSEDTLGAYVEGNYFVGNWRLNGGVRFVETTVNGNKSLEGEQSYTNTLPAINITYEPIEDVLLRAAYSQNIARPNPQNLAGAFSYTPINGNFSVDNPGLKPEKADAIDLAVEWYFAPESYVGLALFQKEISDAITSINREDYLPQVFQDAIAQDPVYDPNDPAYDASAIPPDSVWNISESTNASEVDEIRGVEVGFNYVLPMGLGFLANYTYIDSDALITGLSETSYNLGAFYENETWAARLLVNSRDDYITSYSGSNANAEEATTGPTRVDFSSSYTINEHFDLTLEVINLTNEKERLYTTGPIGDLDLVREYNTTGTEVLFGIRASL
ncbi:TonB-dependent receptor [Gilvimarinus japonicus]|jgi:TonB-dependent receptor|uniref:TonB-dependent receptor n=1 Tax=Gilvimarinus japonicus TaxID=1796469 RepID=A0ABV7HUN5_9GAMM